MLKGHVFKSQSFGNQIFALFINTFLAGHNGVINGYKNSLGLTTSGSSVTVASGALCVQGRFLEEDSSTTIDAGTNTAFCKLVLTINLDRENTASSFTQGYYEILTSASDYPSLTQNDIVGTNEGKYQYELARFKTGLNGITNFVDKRTFLDFDSIYEELESQSNVVFEDELTATLANYVTTTALASALANYVTSSGLSSTLASYVKTTALNNTLANYLLKSGGTLTGDLSSRKIAPSSDNAYDLGSSGYLWKEVWAKALHSTYTRLYASGNTSVLGVFSSLTIRDMNNVNTFMPVSASAFNVNSSRRYKENIEDMTDEEAEKILDIDVVKFDYKEKSNGTDVAGVIAEDAYEILPKVVTLAEVDGKIVPDSVDYSKFVPYLIKEIQILNNKIEELKNND